MNKRLQAPDTPDAGGAHQGGSPEPLLTIEQHFTLCDRAAVLRFLGKHPRLVPVLHELAALIPDHFPASPLFLRIVETGSAIDQPHGRLVLFIATDSGFEEAMDRLDGLMTAWLPDVRRGTGEPFSVGVALGTTAAAVEVAAEQVARAHGDGYTAYREWARRMLDAPDGSEEQAMARAEYIATREEEDGASLGGEARVVLARLRRLRANGQP